MMNRQDGFANGRMVLLLKHALTGVIVAAAVAGCSRDSSTAKSDSAVADSIRAAQSAPTTTTPAGSASAADSAQAPINSTEGTIGETRKRARMHAPDTMDRDSAIPNRNSDALGPIKR